MLKSMTGFSRCENQSGELTCKVEIRSVNNRFIDINARLPKALSSLELPLTKLVKSMCSRGSFDLTVTLERNEQSDSNIAIKANLPLARQYIIAFKEIQEELGLNGEIDIDTILNLKDIVKPELNDIDNSSEQTIFETVEKTLNNLIQMREEEGINLEKDITKQINCINELKQKIATKQTITVQAFQVKLKEKLQQLTNGIEIDPTRIAQETALLAERCDCTEEIIRLGSHLQQFQKLVMSSEPQGRKLEFLTLEINREVNTIGSKTVDLEVSQAVIEMKSHLEKIREQLANIE